MTPPRPEPPEDPAWGGHPQGPPPPPPPPSTTAPYYGASEGYQPFQQYYAPAPAPQRAAHQRQGIAGAIVTALLAIWSFIKFGGLFILKFGAAKTLLTMLVSFGFYALFFGWLGAAGVVVMILLHEMGHVMEIRRQGMKATAPLFIPFLGAIIFQRSHPTDALHQAEIGIAGPIAGTLAAIGALILWSVTGWPALAFWAYFGFFINMFNMIPFGALDGGWILGAASKWFQPIGLAVLVVWIFFFHSLFSGMLIIL